MEFTYHINIHVLHNYTTNGNTINNCDSEFILHGTSNKYDLQSVYNDNGSIGVIVDSPHVYLAVYDTIINPFLYTGSEHMNITDNQISLELPIKINDELVLNPRAYDSAVLICFLVLTSLLFDKTQSMGEHQ